MSRRSSRLVSGGYYNSDEDSDSSSVTNISYRENPVKVFKKKAGNRKSGSRTSNSSPSQEAALSREVKSPSPAQSRTPAVTRTVSFTTATPRPALTPSSSRSQTPTRSSPAQEDKTPYSQNSATNRPGLYVKPQQHHLCQSGVDSSGYSSSEGTGVPSSSGGRRTSDTEAPSNYTSRICSTFLRLKDRISVLAGVTHRSLLANTPLSRSVKKLIGLLLLFILILLCIWFLLPVMSSIISRYRPTKTLTQTEPSRQPVVNPTAPPPLSRAPPAPTASPPSVVDPAIVSAVIEAKIQDVLTDLHRRQEQFLSQMKEQSRLHMQDIQVKLELMDTNSRMRLKQETDVLLKQVSETQSLSQSAADGLALRIQTLEAQNIKLSQELSSIKLTPPPDPCPESNSVHDRLTPELQQAVETWLSQRIKERDELSLRDTGSCSDCGRPMADKMADFALETQGASVISTRCSETFRIRSACVTLFGFPLWYPSESPRTVIQGFPVLLPGKCWAFHGVEGTLVIALSHPVRISHVTLDHLPRYNSPTGRIDSAPKDFEVYGMENDTDNGTLLGTFTYDQDGDSTQTFELLKPSAEVHRFVELRVLSNWGHVEYTCLYRFRVHGTMDSS